MYEDLTIELPMNNIRAPAKAGATLTIRSADANQHVTLTRSVNGALGISYANGTNVGWIEQW
ncbi:MAG: hypothetical protein FWB83_11745 [Treponema sp.]|nr:hypothetical protein [Treponema sp.]